MAVVLNYAPGSEGERSVVSSYDGAVSLTTKGFYRLSSNNILLIDSLLWILLGWGLFRAVCRSCFRLDSSSWLALILILSISLTLFYRSPADGSTLGISDALEYSIGAERLAFHGSYTLPLNGNLLPPRFYPWFSLFVLSPFYILFGEELGNGGYGILIFSLIGTLGTFLLGFKIGRFWGAVGSSFLFLLLPGVRYFGREMVTDLPFSVIGVFLSVLYLSIVVEKERECTLPYLASGILIAFSIALRPIGVCYLIPFFVALMVSREMVLLKVFGLLIPPATIIGLNLVYNLKTFGSYLRTGYNYWAPVPYDYPELLFSIRYLPANLETLSGAILPLIILISYPVLGKVLERKGVDGAINTLYLLRSIRFLVLFSSPIFIFHGLYFYSTERFFLPFEVILNALAGALLFAFVGGLKDRRNFVLSGLVLLTGIGLWWVIPSKSSISNDREVVRELNKILPSGGVVISGINPLYLEYFLRRDGMVKILPISRRVEYASKVLSKNKIEGLSPAPEGPFDHRALGLLSRDVVEVYPEVAILNPEAYLTPLREGQEVVLDSSRLNTDEISAVEEHVRLKLIGGELYRLELK